MQDQEWFSFPGVRPLALPHVITATHVRTGKDDGMWCDVVWGVTPVAVVRVARAISRPLSCSQRVERLIACARLARDRKTLVSDLGLWGKCRVVSLDYRRGFPGKSKPLGRYALHVPFIRAALAGGTSLKLDQGWGRVQQDLSFLSCGS